MRRVLVTGMSGTGKSSALAALERLGFQVIDTDEPGWTEWSDRDGGCVWREERIAELLARDDGPSLYVSGAVSRFYSRFDSVVLLSAPREVLLSRIENRTTNPFGKSPEQLEAIVRDLAEVEPLLRRTCTREIDATQPLTAIGRATGRPGSRAFHQRLVHAVARVVDRDLHGGAELVGQIGWPRSNRPDLSNHDARRC
jgi:broad-specificity NMP kinase